MPGPYKKISVERVGNRYNLRADGIHRGFADDDRVARLLGDPVESDHLARMVGAFTDENPYAKSAENAIATLGGLSPHDEARAELIAEGQALATLALAYEQRQTRYDIETAIANHAQQTAAP